MKRPGSMWITSLEVLVVFSCTWLLTHGRGQEALDPKIMCNDTKALDDCWNKLPPIKDHGIPSNPQAVDNACKVFDSGMECVDNWSKTCLTKQDQEKVKSSVSGALETYRFLCTDKRFRRDFLQHADCYKRISHHWDECARKFIESLKRVDHARDVLSLCCIRFRYLHCVSTAANHLCSRNATQFLQKLAESLVRSTMRTYHPSQCNNIGDRNCSDPSSSSSSTNFISASPSLSLLHRILAYSTKGIVNSLNVLQNSAFTDINTFLCALSREFSPYFSHHLQREDDEDEDDMDYFLSKDWESSTTTSATLKATTEICCSCTTSCSHGRTDRTPGQGTNDVAQET